MMRSMDLQLSPQDHLMSRLRQLGRDGQPAPCLCVRAVRAHAINSAVMDHPGLAIPLQGQKRMQATGTRESVDPGEVMVIASPCTLDMENLPDPATGEYLAVGLFLPAEVLDAARVLWGRPVRPPERPVSRLPLAPLVPDLGRWLDALDTVRAGGSEAPLRHALAGIALQLCAQGLTGVLAPQEPTLAARIRAMVAAQPAQDWRSEELEATLGLSGATLRRRLATEGTSLRRLVADARLARALELLYGTRLPIKTVAQRVGYASPASFVKRFGERYGIDPSRIADTPLA